MKIKNDAKDVLLDLITIIIRNKNKIEVLNGNLILEENITSEEREKIISYFNFLSNVDIVGYKSTINKRLVFPILLQV